MKCINQFIPNGRFLSQRFVGVPLLRNRRDYSDFKLRIQLGFAKGHHKNSLRGRLCVVLDYGTNFRCSHGWRSGLAVERWTYDRVDRRFDSHRGQLRSNFGPSCSHLRASVSKQYNLVSVEGLWRYPAGKVTAGLVESNGSLPPGMT